jgi:hypothetical protein
MFCGFFIFSNEEQSGARSCIARMKEVYEPRDSPSAHIWYTYHMKNIQAKKKNLLFIVALVILTSLISFFLGRLSVLEIDSGGVEIYYPDIVAELAGDDSQQKVYASKNGSKYYFDWCSSQVKDSNKVYFNSTELAQGAGYTLASGCREY